MKQRIQNIILKVLIAVIILLLAFKSLSSFSVSTNNTPKTEQTNQNISTDEVFDIPGAPSSDDEKVPISTACLNQVANSDDYNNTKPSNLYAKYAALIDATNGRVLFEKDGFSPAANASTTKIMTLIIALEYGNPDQVATVSKYATTMPDVQLNMKTGETYYLHDLMYSLMLQSHNDSAVAIAENTALNYMIGLKVSGNANIPDLNYTLTKFDTITDFSVLDLSTVSIEQSKELVHIFTCLMNEKAKSVGCTGTYFITPNGLDDQDESGKHSTTAVDLARIMAYCIKNQDFLKITQTQSYCFNNIICNPDGTKKAGARNFSLNNANAFLQMMDGVLSGKTGFTNDAGYCYVCALKRDDKVFISTVLASGWPNNKTYKWTDTKKIFSFGIDNYFSTNVFTYISDYKDIPVKNGKTPVIKTCINSDVSMLLSRFDNINIIYTLPEAVKAPIHENDTVGTASIYLNDQLYCELPILAKTSSKKVTFLYSLQKIIQEYLP